MVGGNVSLRRGERGTFTKQENGFTRKEVKKLVYKPKWMRQWLENSETTIQFMDHKIRGRREGSENTVATYTLGVHDFLKFIGEKSPDAVIEKIKQGETNVAIKVDMWISDAMKRLAPGSVNVYLAGVKRWLKANHIKVDWETEDVVSPYNKTVIEDRVPTKGDLRQLTNSAYSLRDRSVIACALSSGLRIGTLFSLNWSDVDFECFDDVAIVTVKAKKGRKLKEGSYITFFSTEAIKLLERYRRKREKNGEKITEDSPLFVVRPLKGKKVQTTDMRMSPEVFRMHWKRILKRAGLNGKSGNWFELHFHVLRKYFQTHCIIAGVKPQFYNHWLGRKTSIIKSDDSTYLNKSYFRAVARQHCPEYKKVLSYVTLAGTELEIGELRDRVESTERDIDKIGLILVALEEEFGRDKLTEIVKTRIRSIKERGDI